MNAFAAATILQISLLASTPVTDVSYSYNKARELTAKTGRPMMVLVGAEWCPACVKMKNQIIPKIAKNLLKKVSFAMVDLDKDSKLGRELTQNGPIPQLVMFRQVNKQWKARRLIGGTPVGKVEHFIEEGLDLDAKAKSPQPKQNDKNTDLQAKKESRSKTT
jgi:thiol-disulfide isomerase/thioredoxin